MHPGNGGGGQRDLQRDRRSPAGGAVHSREDPASLERAANARAYRAARSEETTWRTSATAGPRRSRRRRAARRRSAAGSRSWPAAPTCRLELKDKLAAPERLVRIRHLKELQGIRAGNGRLRIGAATLLADIVEHAAVQQQTPLLAMAAGKVGTPQIRNMGTIGGNLCQRPRCWYYRNNYPCFKHGGNACFSVPARTTTTPSSKAGRRSSFTRRIRRRRSSRSAPRCASSAAAASGRSRSRSSSSLPRQDVARARTSCCRTRSSRRSRCRTRPAGSKAIYVKEMVRETWDFALCSVAAMVTLDDGIVQDARIVLGGVAPDAVSRAEGRGRAQGKRARRGVGRARGRRGGRRRAAARENGYKVPLTQAVVKRALAVAGVAMTDGVDLLVMLIESVEVFNSHRAANPGEPVVLADANLHGRNLAGADLRGANLFEADLGFANLEGANLEGADLRRSMMEGCRLAGARLDGARMDYANLRSAKLRGASLRRVTFRSGVLQGADLEDVSFEGANLYRVSLCDANLRGVSFADANLEEADLRWAKYAVADLTGVDLTLARLRM